jgi:site-specific DNA-cytosine methylase
MSITYGSVRSGIETAMAWHPLGMCATWFAEIEPFPSAVLAHHYPHTPNLGDMTKLAAQVLAGRIPAPDVLVGRTPCQAFSVAGMREGQTDPRGTLTIKYVELAIGSKPSPPLSKSANPPTFCHLARHGASSWKPKSSRTKNLPYSPAIRPELISVGG